MRIDREQLLRLATFWLRPDFILRVVARFQSIVGFDRAIALASSALTAVIPLTIFISAVLPTRDAASVANSIIERYDLTGGGAEAVQEAFAPATSESTSLGILGFLFMLVAVLSFTRGVQRLFEQTWELPALSVRNTMNGLRWLLALVVYLGVSGAVHGMVDEGLADVIASVVLAPVGVAFLIGTGWILSGKRIPVRDLIPFGLVGAVAISIYSIGASIYMPHMFSTYAGRYGVIGAVFAMISSLFAMMVALVGSAAAGREVRVELDNIRDGVRPSDDEVRKQWDIVIAGAREKYAMARGRLDELRERRTGGGDGGSDAGGDGGEAPPDPGATSDPAG